ncbi:MAG: hypothetical protein NUV67_06030 [archaeon]|nr:hypothetical protein [archaeon]
MADKPVAKFNAGNVKVAVWENAGKEGRVFHSISLEKVYKEKDSNEWKSTHSLKPNELPKAILALQKAYEFISLRENAS